LWLIHVFCRVQNGGSAAYTGLNLALSPSTHPTTQVGEATSGFATLSQTTTMLAAANDTVTPQLYHERGTTLTTLAALVGIRLAWLGAL
jgi:hypothetical protein